MKLEIVKNNYAEIAKARRESDDIDSELKLAETAAAFAAFLFTVAAFGIIFFAIFRSLF